MSISLMIVDDDIDDIDMFMEAVQEIGTSVDCISAQNGVEGIRLFNGLNSKPDFIFVDMNMPKLNGRQFIKEIRKNNLFDHIKLIMYSTCKLEEEEAELKYLGADTVITKPTSLAELRHEITKVITK